MFQFTAPQVTLIVAVVGLVAGLAGWMGRGLTFIVRRWWTGEPRHEHASYLNSVADLAGKLRASGMTIRDVHQFEAIMRNPAIAGSASANEMVEGLADDAHEAEAFQTNAAMKARTVAAYGVAEAQLEQALMDLRLLLGDREAKALETAQTHWKSYRRALEVCAALEFEGGSHAPLAAMVAGLGETDRRTTEVRDQVQERAAR